jgi:5-formyltetrahydrofolate cyclo-ligase
MRVAPPSYDPPMTGMIGGSERERVRREMRARRRAVSADERAAAAAGFARIARRELLLRPRTRLVVYLAHGHEADLTPLIRAARSNRCRLYLPAIVDYRNRRMHFLEYLDHQPLRANRYGIREPLRERARQASLRELDFILMPLVAVDAHGARLGTGAGFYDRRLHRLRSRGAWRRPKLIGVAYEFQRVARLDAAPWDVPLDGLITERNFYRPVERDP